MRIPTIYCQRSIINLFFIQIVFSMQLVRHYKDELDKLEYNRKFSGNIPKHMNVKKRYNFTYY